MSSQKDIRRAMLGAGLARANSTPSVPVEPTLPPKSERVVAGAIGAVSRSLDQFQNELQTAQDLVASGAAVIELDPADVDASDLKDRLEIDSADHRALADAIRENGQQVPILVRPHPQMPGRYQVAYGHRRLAACSEIGFRVRAVVRKLTDRELFVAQGQENSARRDLSFIERALFAHRLEARGIDREAIMSALDVDKTEVSKLISVAKAVPSDLVEAIGPAPKAGRPRWLALAERSSGARAAKITTTLTSSDGFRSRSTDERFKLVFDALAPNTKQKPESQKWVAEDGVQVARIERDKTACILSINEKSAPKFGQFLIDQLPALYAAFKNESERH